MNRPDDRNTGARAVPGAADPRLAIALVLLAAASTFALTMGARQSMGLFLSPLNTATGLGVGSISLAFAFGQLWWGLTQLFAGAIADRIGTGRVIATGVLLVALGTFLTPFMTTTADLVLTIGVLAAGGAGVASPAVLMSAAMRLLPQRMRGMATGLVNAGGSFGQFAMAPIVGALMVGGHAGHGRSTGPVGSDRARSRTAVDQGSRIVEPVVLRASRSWCALTASASA